MIAAGLGCRAGTGADALLAVLREAEACAGLTATLLAAPVRKAAEPGLAEAARRLGLALRIVGDAEMRAAQAGCVTVSAVVLAHTGLGSVAEAAALAACGPGAVLRQPRIARDGATCALAEGPGP